MPANLENSAVATGLEKDFIPITKKGNAKECSIYHTTALISHSSKVMLKILQARLEQYVNCEPQLESRPNNTNTKFWGFVCYALSIPFFSTPFLMDVVLIASIQTFSEMIRAWTPQFISDGLPGVCSNWPFRNVLIHVFKLKLQETGWNFRRNLEMSEILILGT